jgi:hypothetical protein
VAELEPLGAIARHRLLLRGALALELLLGLAQPGFASVPVVSCSGSSSPRASPWISSSAASIRPASARISLAICS